MPRQLPKIRYNLRERGRKFGIPRDDLDIADIVKKMNGEECQERIAMRDVQGYLGHWPRVKFNTLKPVTGGLFGGKTHYIEPALVTTALTAFPDGTVEHQSEFLDTDSGIIAGKMWDNKVGGFSSAIDLNNNAFFGFDYVPDPNFVKNSFRGIALDSSSMTTEDMDMAASNEFTHAVMLVINQKEWALDQANAALNNAVAENEELLSILAAKNISPDLFSEASQRPISIALDSTQRMQRLIEDFDTMPLAQVVSQNKRTKEDDDYDRILKAYRFL